MLAYHILCHDNYEQVSTLLDSLYSVDDVFLVDVDPGLYGDTEALSQWKKKPNIHFEFDANIGWGASGILRKTLLGSFKLLELDKKWSYYIVLSGQDLPLKSNDHIKSYLAKGINQKTNYIRCHKADEIDLSSVKISNKGKKTFCWGDRGHTRVFAKPGAINPQDDMYARTFVDVLEIGEDCSVYVGTADVLTRELRSNFFSKYPYHIGANWFNLHRTLIEYMRKDQFMLDLFGILKNTFIPEEAFFQTYIMNSKFRDTINQNYGRLIIRPGSVPRVKIFDMSDLEMIVGSDKLYGRKFDTRVDNQIIDEVMNNRDHTVLNVDV